MEGLIGVVLGCTAFYFLNAYIQNDISWFGLLYNDGIEGSNDTDAADRVLALVCFFVSGVIGYIISEQ